MKKILFLIIAMTAFTSLASAQMQLSFGPGAGFNGAFHSSDEDEEVFSHFGALVTSQFDLQFSRRLALLLWVDFFSDMSVKDEWEGMYEKWYLHYFQISPTLKYCLRGSKFYLFTGPGFGFKTKGKIKYTDDNYTKEEDIYDICTRVDLRFGAGYDFFLTKKFTLSPFAMFNVGLNNVVKDSDWRINAIQAGIILRFNTF